MSAAAGLLGPAGWLRLVARSCAGLVLLLVCLVLYPLATILRGRNPVPRLFLSGMARVAGARLTVLGEPVQAPSILLANHVSWLDIPALAAVSGTAFVAHDGLAGHPLVRFLCRMNRTVFIARHDRSSIAAQIAQVQSGLRKSGILTLFPEGTTGDGHTVLPFKSSLLAAVEGSEHGTTIRPVWIDYGAPAPEIAWTGEEPGLVNARRILARSDPLRITIHLLPPLSAGQHQNRKAMAEAARNAILARMDQRVAL